MTKKITPQLIDAVFNRATLLITDEEKKNASEEKGMWIIK